MKNKFKKGTLSLVTLSSLIAGSASMINADNLIKTAGYENSNASLLVEQVARYDSGVSNEDGGVTEIVDYNTKTGFAYVVNGYKGVLTSISLNNIRDSESLLSLSGTDINIKDLVESDDFVYGDMTSVSVSHDGKLLAVAIQGQGTNDNGRVALFDCNDDGSIALKQLFKVGVQPDMVTFTKDDKKVLSANEGEPRDGYESIDPEGSVSVIDVETNTVTTVGFDNFEHDDLVSKGIILKKNTTPAKDLEPEYIAVSDTKAYITLQEANAIAVMDLNTLEMENIYSVGFEDYSRYSIDIDKKDEKYEPKLYASLKGIRMPDAISVYTSGGIDYVVTANEGDSREWQEYLNEDERNFGKGKTSPTGNITSENSGLTGKVVFFDQSDYDGLDSQYDYLFGGRSATVFKVNNNSLEEMHTTGNDFESKTATYLPENFNCSNDDKTIDDRSGKKGVEAEGVTIGTIGNKTYAFIGLERIGGVMIYDITNPNNVQYVNYINSRDFSDNISGDVSPEGMRFITGDDNKAKLVVAYEVSGTVGVYDLKLKVDDNQVNTDNKQDNSNPQDKVDNNDQGESNPQDKPNKEEVKLDNNEEIKIVDNKQTNVKTGDNTNIVSYVVALITTAFISIILKRKLVK